MISSKMKKRMNQLKQALVRPRKNSLGFHVEYRNPDGTGASFKFVIGRSGRTLRILV